MIRGFEMSIAKKKTRETLTPSSSSFHSLSLSLSVFRIILVNTRFGWIWSNPVTDKPGYTVQVQIAQIDLYRI